LSLGCNTLTTALPAVTNQLEHQVERTQVPAEAGHNLIRQGGIINLGAGNGQISVSPLFGTQHHIKPALVAERKMRTQIQTIRRARFALTKCIDKPHTATEGDEMLNALAAIGIT